MLAYDAIQYSVTTKLTQGHQDDTLVGINFAAAEHSLPETSIP